MKHILLAVLCGFAALLGAGATGKLLPNGNIELANKFLKAEITPVKGGRVIKLVDLRNNCEYAGSAWDLGAGGELDWQARRLAGSTWFGKPFSCQLESFPGGQRVRCERTGTGASGQWITIHKTYTLKDDSSRLVLDYRIAVNPAAMKTYSFCLWLHNAAQVKNESGTVRFVKETGTAAIPFNSGSPRNESFHYDLADGWFAFARTKAPSGIIHRVPFRDLMCFYNWQGQQGNTMEILFRSQRIPCGKSYDTTFEMVLYDGLRAPNGCGGGLVGEFTASGMNLYASEDAKGEIAVTNRRPPQLLESPVKTFSFDLKAGKTASFAFPQAPAGSENIVRVKQKGKLLMSMRKPNAVKNYVRLADEPRRGSDKERFGQVILNDADKQDCFDWDYTLPPSGKPFLKPDASGKLKMLVVTDLFNGREVTELANRMDSEVTSATMSTSGWISWHPVWGHAGGQAESNLYLGETLKKKYDVIILAGFQIGTISKENMDKIAQQVKNGAGFISVMPSAIPEAYKGLFPVTPLIKENFKKIDKLTKKSGKYTVAPDSPVKNFPFDRLPQVWLFPAKSTAAKITTNGQPFLSIGSFGKGRTAAFTWLTGRPDNTRRAGIAPYFAKENELPWHEYFYGMIIQAAKWSARRESPVTITNFTADTKNARITLKNTLAAPVKGNFEFTVRHTGVKDQVFTVSKEIKPGTFQLTIPLKGTFYGGVNPVELRLGANDLALDFAVAAAVSPKAQILKIAAPDKMNLPGKPFKASFTAKGSYDKAVFELIDPAGRLIAKGGIEGREFTVTPRAVAFHRAELYVSLLNKGVLQDRRRIIVDTVPESELTRVWDKYNVMISWPQRDTRAFAFHLQEIRERTLKELGIDTVMAHGIPTHWGQDNEAKFMLNYRYVGRLVMESITRLNARSGIPGFKYPQFDYRNRKQETADFLANYAKDRNKFAIKRYPRGDDPAYFAAYEKAMEYHMPKLIRFRPYIYDLGDEMSFSTFNRPVDFDFSPESLAAFRVWLKKRYKDDLAKLNAEWKRSYKTWEEVVPDTGLEARERKVFSAWALHRIYNTTLFAHFWKVVADKARQLDPGVIISASGTPAAHPYNGFDYELLLPVVDTLSAYTTQGTSELLNSFKKLPLSAWVGYGAPEPSIWRTIWNNAFNGHFGASFYTEIVMINPDLTLTERGKWMRDAVKPLKEGAGALLYYTEKPVEAAILTSTPSMMAVWADHTSTDYDDARTIWVTLLKRAKCNVRFVTPSMLESGVLQKAGFKVLVLPFALALSDKEIAAIKAFIAKGGQVIADVAPGKYNENVALRAGKVVIPGMTVIGGKLTQEYETPDMKQAAATLDALLKKAGIGKTSSVLTIASGTPEVTSFLLCADSGEVFGVWSPGKKDSVKLSPVKGGKVYAVLAGKSVSGKFALRPEKPEVFVSLPYAVKGIGLAAKKQSDGVAVTAQVRPDRGKVLRHVLKFRVFDAKGNELNHFGEVLNAPGGKAVFKFHPALNETGPFKVEALDVISKVKGTCEVK